MDEKNKPTDLPSRPMTKPYWLEGEKLRREGVLVDGDLAWELFCACADGDDDQVRALLEKDRKLMHAQLWYCKPIDLALRHGLLESRPRPGESAFLRRGQARALSSVAGITTLP